MVKKNGGLCGKEAICFGDRDQDSRRLWIRYIQEGGINPYLVSYFGQWKLKDISSMEIETYKQMRLKSVSSASVNRELAALKHTFNQAVKWGITTRNPVKGVGMLKETPRTRYLSLEEEHKLLSTCPHWLGEIVLFALHSGMRQGEILSLLRGDINLTQKTILVRQSKNGLPRTIPMNRVLYSLLESKRLKSPTDKVFPVNRYTLSHTFRMICRELGIEDFRFHDLRHSFSTRLSQSGCNVFQLQALLGINVWR